MIDTTHGMAMSAGASRIMAHADRAFAGIVSVAERVRRRLRMRSTERSLMALSDAMLKDIGLNRSEVHSIVLGLDRDAEERRR